MSHHKPVTQAVYDGIYTDIVNGDITANDILTEGKLCEKYGASKSPVREALVMLCSQNILISVPRTGYLLRQFMPKEVEDLVEAREALELFLLSKTMARLSDEGLHSVEKVHQEIQKEEQLYQSVRDNWQRNVRFHLALAALADNTLMREHLQRLLQSCERATTQFFQGRWERGVYEELHIPLLEAMRERDGEAARDILRQDIHLLL